MIPEPPAVPDAREFRKLADGTLGEFDFRVLLAQYTSADDGNSAAEHLVGGVVRIAGAQAREIHRCWRWRRRGTRRGGRGSYFDLYNRVMQGKWKKVEFTSETCGSR